MTESTVVCLPSPEGVEDPLTEGVNENETTWFCI